MNTIIRTTHLLAFCALCAAANAADKPDQATVLVDAAKQAMGGSAWDELAHLARNGTAHRRRTYRQLRVVGGPQVSRQQRQLRHRSDLRQPGMGRQEGLDH